MTLALLKQRIRSLQDGYQNRIYILAGVQVTVEQPAESCSSCQVPMPVQKTVERTGMTLSHGSFRIRESVRACRSAGCKEEGSPATHRARALAELIPPRSRVGYDVMVHIGLERFVHHRQREEIRDALDKEHRILLSSGEISELGRRFLIYLEALHRASAPALRAALETDGGWPLHVDATGEDGRGTLLTVYAGWRGWVLGAWKIPTEHADAILPRLKETRELFGTPCAVMRDLGRAMKDAADEFVRSCDAPIPILACHYHFLQDVGGDLLREDHDRLRALFRQIDVRKDLRALARQLGRSLGKDIDAARQAICSWLDASREEDRLPEAADGMAVVRALAQWPLDSPADGSDQGFPFDLPYLQLYYRCLEAAWATKAFLHNPPDDLKVKRALVRLERILRPLECDVPPFFRVAQNLEKQVKLFNELRAALRLEPTPTRGRAENKAVDPESALAELNDIQAAVEGLEVSLRQRRPDRGPAKDVRRAIDIVLSHLERHRDYLWGHVITLPENIGGGFRLVDRTNNSLETTFHTMKRGERRRSGRKILARDFEQLPPEAALAINLARADYVELVCGSLDQLPQAFAKLDAGKHVSLAAASARMSPVREVESASLSLADRAILRMEEMRDRIIAAARRG